MNIPSQGHTIFKTSCGTEDFSRAVNDIYSLSRREFGDTVIFADEVRDVLQSVCFLSPEMVDEIVRDLDFVHLR